MAVSEVQVHKDKLKSFYYSGRELFAIIEYGDGKEVIVKVENVDCDNFEFKITEDSFSMAPTSFFPISPLALFPDESSLAIGLDFFGKRNFKYTIEELYPSRKKLTKSQIEEQLGYPIEIVK